MNDKLQLYIDSKYCVTWICIDDIKIRMLDELIKDKVIINHDYVYVYLQEHSSPIIEAYLNKLKLDYDKGDVIDNHCLLENDILMISSIKIDKMYPSYIKMIETIMKDNDLDKVEIANYVHDDEPDDLIVRYHSKYNLIDKTEVITCTTDEYDYIVSKFNLKSTDLWDRNIVESVTIKDDDLVLVEEDNNILIKPLPINLVRENNNIKVTMGDIEFIVPAEYISSYDYITDDCIYITFKDTHTGYAYNYIDGQILQSKFGDVKLSRHYCINDDTMFISSKPRLNIPPKYIPVINRLINTSGVSWGIIDKVGLIHNKLNVHVLSQSDTFVQTQHTFEISDDESIELLLDIFELSKDMRRIITVESDKLVLVR